MSKGQKSLYPNDRLRVKRAFVVTTKEMTLAPVLRTSCKIVLTVSSMAIRTR